MVLSIIFGILGSLLFLFVFWRKLKEDYVQDQIFSTGFYVLTGIILGALLAVNFRSSWWFWSSLSGALLGLSMGVEKYKLRMFETLEASIYGGLILCACYFLFDFVSTARIFSLYYLLLNLVFIGLFEFLNAHYRKFSWYKSGRVGFSGLTIAGLFFISRAIVAVFFPDTASVVGKSDVMLSAIFAFISFISVYNLSRKTL